MVAIRVVLVDDDPFIRDLFATSLETAGGFEIVGEAGDALSAVEVVAAVEPDVVLLDHMMPGVTGIAVLPELKRACPRARVLVVSAAEDVADEALAAGADLFVAKPRAARDLPAALRGVMAPA
jgi:DNA-binding NarL/FixJ family response regulator